MMRWLALVFALFLTLPAHAAGRLERFAAFPSRHVDPRNVTVWLPEDYDPKSAPYAVIYMQDGQNLFEPGASFGGEEWGVDETVTALRAAGRLKRAIVVGIWNTPRRFREYVPARVIARLPFAYQQRISKLYEGTPLSDAYLRFVVEELKPFIDRRYRTSRRREDTAIMGSSMGGLISLYALTEYPDIFGGAGCISTHWPLFRPKPGEVLTQADINTVATAFEGYLKAALPRPGTHRIWFDHGTETRDSLYAPYQQRIDRLMAARGWVSGRDWESRVFPGTAHTEAAWRARLDQPLRFLLGTDTRNAKAKRN